MVACVALNCLGSRADSVVVVTGCRADDVERSVTDAVPRDRVRFVFAHDYPVGLSASLRAGVAALPQDVEGALVCLGDMPLVQSAVMDRIIGAFDAASPDCVVVPCWRGRRGNPVLWGRSFFTALDGLRGDAGARGLLDGAGTHLVEVMAGSGDILTDFDTPEALIGWREWGR